MILKIHKNDEFQRVFNENAPPYRIVIIDSSCVMQGCSFDINSNFCEPLLLLILDSGDLVILATELAEDLNDSPLNLEFCLAGHQG